MTRVQSNHRIGITMVMVLALAFSLLFLQTRAYGQGDAQPIINDAANALGGRDKVLGARTLVLEGGGHELEPGQGLRWDELGVVNAVIQIRDYKRSYDLMNDRMRTEMTQQREYIEFQGEGAAHQIQCLDGDVAFNVSGSGKAFRVFGPGQEERRVEYLRHPLTLVRTALDPEAKLTNVRSVGNERLLDLTTGKITLTIAFDAATKLPTRVIQMTDDPTLGDTPVETSFSDYKAVGELMLPTRFATKTGRFATEEIRVLRQAVSADIGDLAAPPDVASATPPPPAQPIPAPAREIAKGIWYVTGTTHHSILVEFSNHMVLIEAPNVERTLAVMAKAKELRPNKPVTVLVVTHHHNDHTGGIRTAVAMGVTEVIAQKSNVELLNEIFSRPHTINPDLFSKTPGAKPPTITAIDDEGVIKDGTMTINLYHLLENSHADSQLIIYFPQARILSEVDDYSPGDARYIIPGEPLGHAPWNQNLLANINYRKLQVDYIAALHGEYVPYSQFLENAITMTLEPEGNQDNK